MVTHARWTGASELCQATRVHHHLYPVSFLTHCRLPLSTHGGKKHADVQPWHFGKGGQRGGHKGGQ